VGLRENASALVSKPDAVRRVRGSGTVERETAVADGGTVNGEAGVLEATALTAAASVAQQS